MRYEINELIEASKNLLDTLSYDKDVKEKKWWLDQRARLAEAVDEMIMILQVNQDTDSSSE